LLTPIRGCASGDDEPDVGEPRCEPAILGSAPDICGNPLTQVRRHVAPPVKTEQAIDRQRRVARLSRSGNVGCRRCTRTVGHDEQPRGSAFKRRIHGRQCGNHHVKASSIEVVHGRRRVAVWDVLHLELLEFEKRLEHHLRKTRRRTPQILVGAASDQRDELRERMGGNVAPDGDSHADVSGR
jgi:hypothetical protein